MNYNLEILERYEEKQLSADDNTREELVEMLLEEHRECNNYDH